MINVNPESCMGTLVHLPDVPTARRTTRARTRSGSLVSHSGWNGRFASPLVRQSHAHDGFSSDETSQREPTATTAHSGGRGKRGAEREKDERGALSFRSPLSALPVSPLRRDEALPARISLIPDPLEAFIGCLRITKLVTFKLLPCSVTSLGKHGSKRA
jgi:hypothetical protein